jgi:tripartite-type tricarboxylate transporter receptor subunit TctC
MEMMMLSTRWLMIVPVLFALLWAPSVSLAQQWPERTVKVVVPYGAGGVTDIMARVTADRLGKILKQTFVVEDKPGAGGAIGVNYAMHAPQDGYTLLFVGSTLFTVLPLVQNVDYVPLKDLVPVSITGTNGMILVVAKDAPYSTLSQFISFARAHPEKITYSSGGTGTNNHLSAAYLAGKEDLNMVHVPFRGGQAALEAVLAKSVDMHFGNSSDLIGPVNSGTVKALAVSTPKRMAQLPQVPAVAETIPGFEYVAWNGYAVTGGVPPQVTQRLAAALQTVAHDPSVVAAFAKLGIDSAGTTQEQALDGIHKDMPVYARIIDMAGLPKVRR